MTPKRLYEIDILRFFAAIMVVFFHYNIDTYQLHRTYLIANDVINALVLKGNFGVKLFFMISGFVIFMSALNSTPKKFVKSRILRLFPAFFIMCTITFLTSKAFDKSYNVGIKDYLINSTLIGTFASWAGIKLVAGVYWTLIVEIQFYFFVFLLLVFDKTRFIRYALCSWLILSVFTYYGELYFNFHLVFNKIRILMITEHSYYFVAGCYFYLIKYQRQRFDIYMPLITLCLAVLCFINHPNNLLTLSSIILLISFFSIFYFIALYDLEFKRNLSLYKVMGNLTFPLYLIHENLGIILTNLLIFHLSKGLILVSCVLTTLTLTYFFNIYIDLPFTRKFKSILFK